MLKIQKRRISSYPLTRNSSSSSLRKKRNLTTEHAKSVNKALAHTYEISVFFLYCTHTASRNDN